VTVAAEADDPAPFGPAVAAFDAAVDRWLDRRRGTPVVDRVMYTASAVGDWSLIWHAIGVVAAVARPATARRSVRLSAVLGAESLIVNQGVKRLFRRVRPSNERDHPHGLRTPSTSSFPSGHASSAFCAAVVLSDAHPAAAPVWFALATVIAVSRPYVGIHHASDTVAGAAIGATIGAAAVALTR
jgi:undecaprenyl-diphosphatase